MLNPKPVCKQIYAAESDLSSHINFGFPTHYCI